MDKTTLVLGASPNPNRFAYKAIRSLQRRHIPVVAIGRRDVDLDANLKIRKGKPSNIGKIHTVTLYMNARFQQEYYDYIIKLEPKRIIFNPGTINPELAELARKAGIEVVEDCLLVMLNNGRF
ncbi:MAG: CoA-binding protein [Bacteroidales bacterium]|jgi:predicted CoA-binding protein|nr:CoA-binding protein [Bacteroidales bacterium]